MSSIRIARFWCFFYALKRTKRNNSEQFRTSWIKLEQATLKSILAPRNVTIFAMSSEMSSQYVSGPSLERREHDKDEKIQVFRSNLQRRHRQRGKKTDGTDQQMPEVATKQGI